MTSAPPPPAPTEVNDSVVCDECGHVNPNVEIYCAACGVSLEAEVETETAVLGAPFQVGTLLGETYRIISVDSIGTRNSYCARCEPPDGRIYLISEEARGPLNGSVGVGPTDDPQSGGHGATRSSVSKRLGEIDHPALIVPRDRLEHEGRSYQVVPKQPGIPLSSRSGRTSEREAVGWGIQLCQAVGVLHRHGLWGVELPPQYVILDKQGGLHLTQLHAVRLKDASRVGADESEEEDAFVTDGYAAPETYRSDTLSEAADVFAVGACLYSVLIGRRLPVEGWAVQPEPPLFYPEKVITPQCERILRKALAFRPEERHADLSALKQDLLSLRNSIRSRSAWHTDVGLVREHNEDAVLVHELGRGGVAGVYRKGLYLVSDGMGGAEAGEVASQIATETVAEQVSKVWATDDMGPAAWEDRLVAAAIDANARIVQYGKEHPESAGLGATLVAALIQDDQLSVAWVGDSRAYVLEHGTLSQISHDHSLVARLVEIGQLSEEEALTHEHRNVLIRSLGAKDNVTVDTLSQPLLPGTRLLLCSDGLTSHVRDAALADILSRHRTPEDACLELVAAANTGGGSDNTSVVVVFYE